MTRSYWLSYDLGVGGDYEHLYQWLDDHDALPCGNSVALFKFTTSEKNIDEALTKELMDQIKLFPGNLLYVVRQNDEGKTRGKFLFGKRKSAPWIGFGSKAPQNDDE